MTLAHDLLTDALADIQSRRAIYKHNHRGETERTPEYRLVLAQFDAEEADTIIKIAALDEPRLPNTEARLSHISTAVMALNGLFEAHKNELRSDLDSLTRSLAEWQERELEKREERQHDVDRQQRTLRRWLIALTVALALLASLAGLVIGLRY